MVRVIGRMSKVTSCDVYLFPRCLVSLDFPKHSFLIATLQPGSWENNRRPLDDHPQVLNEKPLMDGVILIFKTTNKNS